jgi:cytoskeletal protein RodZ
MTESNLHDDTKSNESLKDSGGLGHHALRQIREDNQWTIDSVAIQLKIRPSQIIAMEAGDWDNICPDYAFAHSYLRNYIQLLGLPVEETLKHYGDLHDKPNTIHSVNTVGTTLNVPRRHWHLPRAWRWLIIVSVVLVILWQLFDQWAVSSWLSEMSQSEPSQ